MLKHDWVFMHVLDGLWAGFDEFGMTMRMKSDWMLVVYWHEIGMHDYFVIGW